MSYHNKKLAPLIQRLDYTLSLAAHFFDSIGPDTFLRDAEELLDGASLGFNYYCNTFICTEAGEIESVRFSFEPTPDSYEERIVSYEQFLVLLRMKAEHYLEDRQMLEQHGFETFDREQVKSLFLAKGIDYDTLSSRSLEVKSIAPQIFCMGREFSLVACFFQDIARGFSPATVEQLLNGVSIFFERTSCTFLSSEDGGMEGVRFRLQRTDWYRDQTVSYAQFLVFLKMATELYLEDYPADREQIKALFEAKGMNYDALSSSSPESTEA